MVKAGFGTIPSFDTMRIVFYNNFDISNSRVKVFLDELHKVIPVDIISHVFVNVAFKVKPSACLNCMIPLPHSTKN